MTAQVARRHLMDFAGHGLHVHLPRAAGVDLSPWMPELEKDQIGLDLFLLLRLVCTLPLHAVAVLSVRMRFRFDASASRASFTA